MRFIVKTTILSFVVFVGLVLLVDSQVLAHDFHQTTSIIFLESDQDDREIPQDELRINIQMDWILVQQMLQDLDLGSIEDISDISEYSDDFQNFFEDHLIISNNTNSCRYNDIQLSSGLAEDIVIKGFDAYLSLKCAEGIEDLIVVNTLFLDSSPIQTNNTLIVTGSETLLVQASLDNDSQILEYSTSTRTIAEDSTSNLEDEDNIVEELVGNVPDLLTQDGLLPIFLILIIATAIGALHTLEAGHSKAILASIMVDKNMTYKKGLAYVGVFTFTHMADILIVAIVLLVTNSFSDLYEQLSLLQAFATYAFAFLSLALLFKAVSELIKYYLTKKFTVGQRDDHGHSHDIQIDDEKLSLRSQLGVAFLTGLAPCLMGWTMLFLVISSGRVWLTIPVIIAFAIGIFIVEIVFMISVKRFSSLLTNNIDWIGRISPLISACILVVVSIGLLMS